MSFVRRHLLACTWFWLLCQAASVSALAPRNCCDAHHARAVGASPCHAAAEGSECPMRDEGGQPCPMHRAAAPAHDHAALASHASHAEPAPAPAGDDTGAQCALRGSCDGPATVLAALLWLPGILATVSADAVDPGVPTAPPGAVRLPVTLRTLDTPPPRLQS